MNKILFKRNFFTIPNYFSIIRILSAFPLFFWALNLGDERLLFFVIATLSFATDFLDGYLARKLNQISEWGKILDPLADKILVNMLMLAFCIRGEMPWWIFIVVLSRDFAILAGGLFLLKKFEKAPASNLLGKIAMFVFSIFILIVVLDLRRHFEFIYELTVILLIISILLSIIGYLLRTLEHLKWSKKKDEFIQKF